MDPTKPNIPTMTQLVAAAAKSFSAAADWSLTDAGCRLQNSDVGITCCSKGSP